tara:strand:+ start:184 stop:570 length:387 start_codon:yes stop_codon:yes gene_type:complete
MRVEVYYNLHKKVFSVRHKGKVIAHRRAVVIENPEFVVRQKGRERVLREGRKNVHAFVRGDYECVQNMLEEVGKDYDRKELTYNPYKYNSFVYRDSEKPISKGSWAFMVKEKDKPSPRMWEILKGVEI